MCTLFNINHLYLKKKKTKKLQNLFKIIEEKNLKKTIKSCNTVQYVCLFTTLHCIYITLIICI